MKSTFEKMGGTYTLGADGIYYPNLTHQNTHPLLCFVVYSIQMFCQSVFQHIQ